MTATPQPPPTDAALRERAAEWHVRLGSDVAEDSDWLAFEAWLAESPAHARAYEAVEALWSDLDAAAPQTAVAEVVALRPRPRRRRAEVWIGAVAACLVAAVALGIGLRLAAPQAETYQTARGERRVVALADGSRLTLNGGSRVSVTLGRRERDVVMAIGEAAFDVAKDPGRPFVIAAGDREIRVVGTEFNVLRHAGIVRVTVRRGVVEVRPADVRGAAPVARLRAGHGLTHREGAARDVVAPVDPDVAFAWTQGRLIFRNERLEDVAKVLNRYVETPIVVAPEARGLRVTAVLNLDSEDVMIRRLTEFLPVEARREAGALRLSARRDAH